MRFYYLLVLAGCLAVTLPLEWVLHVGVYRQWRRLALALAPVVLLFVVWDLLAIAAGHWSFSARWTTGVELPGGLPVEELAFFFVVPICSILTLEAVRRVRGWRV